MFKAFGIALAVLAVGLGVIPQLTDCLSQGLTTTLANGAVQPMKCHWSAVAELGVAVPLFVTGVMLVGSRRKNMLTNLGIFGVVLGAMAIAFPASLIGVCQMPTHVCVTEMKPAILGMGSLTGAIGVVGILFARKLKD
jgi:hypothetical protein